MDRAITRRDFLNGVAIGVGGALASQWLPRLDVVGAQARGAGHARLLSAGADRHARQPRRLVRRRRMRCATARFWARAGAPVDTGEAYDLVVVGGGISGLAAAYFYRARTSPQARAS